MKVVISVFVALVVLGLFGGTIYFLYLKSEEKPVVYTTDKPYYTDIVKKTVANGSILPREEISIKPSVGGILEKVHVKPGNTVRKGDLIARIRIIPNLVSLNNAESRLKTARINLANAEKEMQRNKKLFEQEIVSDEEFKRFELDYALSKEEVEAAENNVQLIKEGASKKTGTSSNLVYATVSGTVLEVPVEEGETVIESNNFNEGTTIASVADMNDMLFIGYVDESEVGKIREGMELGIKVGAIESTEFQGKLEYISPKGIDKDGTIQFELKAAVALRQDVMIRANYSANADIVLDRRDSVLAVKERMLLFETDGVFVEVETTPQVFEKRLLEVGLSDGINIEVLSGIDENTDIKSGEKDG